MAEQMEAILYMYDGLSMRDKRFTHMMSLVTWFGSHIGFTLKPIKKNLLQNGQTDRGETSHKCSTSLGDTRVFTKN